MWITGEIDRILESMELKINRYIEFNVGRTIDYNNFNHLKIYIPSNCYFIYASGFFFNKFLMYQSYYRERRNY